MKKIKLLVVSDDIRMFSGVGIQAKKFLKGLLRTGRYEIVEIAGSIVKSPHQVLMYEGIKLYPTPDGYGNPNLLRFVIGQEKPDIVLAFSDPRFFTYMFMMDNEIRNNSKLVFYHTWDNAPFPDYNEPWYAACDDIAMLSRFSYNLMSSNGVPCTFIPHGMDPSEFYPLDKEEKRQQREAFLAQVKRPDTDFIVFWNNRNITRKRPGDVIYAFHQFSKKYPKSMLLLNTTPVDREGTDMVAVNEKVDPVSSPVVFNVQKVDASRLNVLYNIADVSINISNTEGFGLCVAESLCAGTPVIVTRTGGMTEQATSVTHQDEVVPTEENGGVGCPAHDIEKQFGFVLDPVVRELFGVPGAPYIFKDYVSHEQVIEALECARTSALKHPKEWRELGEAGRDHIVANYHVDNTIRLWDEFLQKVATTPKKYTPWRFITL